MSSSIQKAGVVPEIARKDQTNTSQVQNINTSITQSVAAVDPQVKPNKPRRSFDKAYKARILAAYDACPDAQSRSSFLRREGLYYSCISAWRHEQAKGKI